MRETRKNVWTLSFYTPFFMLPRSNSAFGKRFQPISSLLIQIHNLKEWGEKRKWVQRQKKELPVQTKHPTPSACLYHLKILMWDFLKKCDSMRINLYLPTHALHLLRSRTALFIRIVNLFPLWKLSTEMWIPATKKSLHSDSDPMRL